MHGLGWLLSKSKLCALGEIQVCIDRLDVAIEACMQGISRTISYADVGSTKTRLSPMLQYDVAAGRAVLCCRWSATSEYLAVIQADEYSVSGIRYYAEAKKCDRVRN